MGAREERAEKPRVAGARASTRAGRTLAALAFVGSYAAVFSGLWALGPYVPPSAVAGLGYFIALVGAPFAAAMRAARWIRERRGERG